MNIPLVSQEEDMLLKAEDFIGRGEYEKAELILKQIANDLPENWQPFREISLDIWEYAFWDKEEREAFTPYFEKNYGDAHLQSSHPSYSKVFYHLAFLAFEKDDCKQALSFIDKGIFLEPDHPSLLCEKALILHHNGHLEEAYELYVKAIYARPWMPDSIKAKSLRGAGIILIEKNKLDTAANMLKKSLELDPGNQLAMNELSNIYLLRMENFQKEQRRNSNAWWKFWRRRIS